MSFYVICSVIIIYVLIWIYKKLKRILYRIKNLELIIQYHVQRTRKKEGEGKETEREEDKDNYTR
jgi:hypothetical protein